MAQPQTTGTVVISKCAPGHEQAGDRCIAGGVCSAFHSDSSSCQKTKLYNTDVLAFTYPKITEGRNILLVPLANAKPYHLSGKVSIELLPLAVGGLRLLNCRHQETCRGGL